MTLSFLLKPIFAGLALGAFCLSYCFPFLATFVASDHRSPKENSKLILCFLTGRFLGYMLFGEIIGYLGEKLNSPLLTLVADIAIIVISILLILYLCGILKEKEENCSSKKFQQHSALMMGFLGGINVCPPFLLSIPYILSLHSTFLGVVYFFIFFWVSSIFFLPVVFVGMLAKIKEFKSIARISGFISAGIFIIYGAYSIITTFILKH